MRVESSNIESKKSNSFQNQWLFLAIILREIYCQEKKNKLALNESSVCKQYLITLAHQLWRPPRRVCSSTVVVEIAIENKGFKEPHRQWTIDQRSPSRMLNLNLIKVCLVVFKNSYSLVSLIVPPFQIGMFLMVIIL